MDLKAKIRTIPDYPKPGIQFRDVTTLMSCPEAFAHVTETFAACFEGRSVDKIAGIEARGFIFGAALAHQMGVGFIPIRKAGKLPHKTISRTYTLEYGEDSLEIHCDAVDAGERIVLVDDLLATGGTAIAAAELLEDVGAITEAAAFVVNLPDLGGKARLSALGTEVITLIDFEGH